MHTRPIFPGRTIHDYTTQHACRRRGHRGLGASFARRRRPVISVLAEPALPRSGGADPRSELYQVSDLLQHRRAGRHRHALGRRAGLFPRGRLSPVLRHPQQPDHEVRREDRPDHGVPQPVQLCQRQCARPPGTPRHLRAFGDPPHHPHREGRQGHGAGRQVRGQAAECAERHRGEVRRQHLVHRSAVRHQRRVGRQEGKARAGHHQRLSHRQGRQAHRRHHRHRQSQRPRVLAGREEALRRRMRGARPTAASGATTSTPTARSAAGPR